MAAPRRPFRLARRSRQAKAAVREAFPSDEAAFQANLQATDDDLTKTHHLPLPAEDLEGIARVYRAFYWYGPAMNYSAGINLDLANAGRGGPTYGDLMTQSDAAGQGLSYFASEGKFGVMQDLERRNLVVPVVGNFAGPKALRAVGTWIREHGATVGAFYLSNVEGYLRRDALWNAFCGNVASRSTTRACSSVRPARACICRP